MVWKSIVRVSALGAALLICPLVEVSSAQETTAPDNTKANKRDRRQSEPTADQAKNTPSDRAIMQQIRKSVMADKSLSTYAHNVKIISEDGKVTLKGPVRSEEEKRTIEEKALEVAGAGNVTSEITVKPGKSEK